ncbi:MAG: NAD(+)/NADH kinase [Pseudomonadota bacterium]
MKTIGLYVKKDAQACRKAAELEHWLTGRGCTVIRQSSPSLSADMAGAVNADTGAPETLECVMVLGGDGTFLSAVRWIGRRQIPLLGVKFGEVGFLAETTEDQLFKAAEMVLDNRTAIRERMQLSVTVLRAGRPVMTGVVLNDVVINKGALARLADIETHVDNHYLTTFRADGLIIATPTGSTAYSLAAGGPVIHPGVAAIVMTPICPFTLTNRPLIIPDTACIEMRLAKPTADIMLTMDGQAGCDITGGDIVRICKDNHSVRMITLPDHNYYDILKAKLHWSGGRV